MASSPRRKVTRDVSQVHPELRAAARVLPRRPVTPRTRPLLNRALARLAQSRPPGVEVHAIGDASVRLHRPPGSPSDGVPGIVWIHGGGYVIGAAAQDDPLCRRLAKRHGALVAAVDYRLAPEHPYPAPLDDCYEALTWLAERPEVDDGRIVIAGASAGGGLAAGLAQLAMTRGVVAPVFQALVYPMLDDRTTLRDDIDESCFRLWDNTANRFGWSSYLGRLPGSSGLSAPAVPARAESLSGLPPAWVGVGTLDLFHDEVIEYAERLGDAGVPTDLELVDGAFHGFDAVRCPLSRAFLGSMNASIERALAATRAG